MNKIIFTIILTLNVSVWAFAQNTSVDIELSKQKIQLIYDSNNAELKYHIKQDAAGLGIVAISLYNEKGFSPEELKIKWAVPSNNVAGYWSTQASLDKTITPDWGPAKVKSMLSRHAPIICLFGYDDSNQQTFAVSEALNTVITSTSVKEEDGMIYNEVQLFTEKHSNLTSFEFQFRLDSRAIPFSEAISDVSDWWTTFDLYKPALVPEAAKLPVYSSWYSYHQNVSREALVEECRIAKAMGFESIIVDDGWQTLNSDRGYAYTGDWDPLRIPDMKDFVKDVHDLDMKFILWYAVPFVGEKSKSYDTLKGKFLTYWEGQGAYVLDPRFPEVREFIIKTYVDAVKEWDLDGFKLDFLGRFRVEEDTKLVADEGRDFASINEATDKLMTDLMQALTAIKPDILLEFRQPYTGPAMRKYGNMLRASDCPNVALINRVATTDLRIISGNTAVHADMLMWHHNESVEVAALQLLNVMYAVPQISVQLEEIPKDHFEMIRHYIDYWLKNRAVLLDGEFIPISPQMNYPMLTSQGLTKQITTVFSDIVIPIDLNQEKDFDIINAKNSKDIVLKISGDHHTCQYTIYDCKGAEVENAEITLTKGVHLFEVPSSGLIMFKQR